MAIGSSGAPHLEIESAAKNYGSPKQNYFPQTASKDGHPRWVLLKVAYILRIRYHGRK